MGGVIGKGEYSVSEHKGALSLIIAVLAIFSIYIVFTTGVVQPLVDDIGDKFKDMVSSIFDYAGEPPSGPEGPTE